MLLVLSFTFYFHYNTWGCICSTGPFKYRWLKGYIYSSCYKHHQIGGIHLSHCFHIFSVVVCLRCLLHHILSFIVYTFRENREFVFISIVQFMMSANSRIRFGLQILFVFVHYTISLSSSNFIWRHRTYEMPVRYNLSSAWVRLSIFSQLSIIKYVGLYVFSLPISLVMIEKIYIYFVLLSSSNRKYELLPIVYLYSYWWRATNIMDYMYKISGKYFPGVSKEWWISMWSSYDALDINIVFVNNTGICISLCIVRLNPQWSSSLFAWLLWWPHMVSDAYMSMFFTIYPKSLEFKHTLWELN